MGYRVLVRDTPQGGERRIIGEIDTWIKLDLVLRFNQPGTWQLLVKSGTAQAELLQKGRGIAVYQDGVPEPVFTGGIDAFERYWTNDQHTAEGSVFVSGKSDDDLLYGFLAFPAVSAAGSPLPVEKLYSGTDSRPVAGPVGQVIWSEVDRALGGRALPDRRVDGLSTGPGSMVGPEVKDTLRFDSLGTKTEEWLKDKRVGYRFAWSPVSRQIEFQVYECRDLSKQVRFSTDLGNLKQFTWQLKAPTVTRAIVACQGEGSDRYLLQRIDIEGEAEWGVMREFLVDRRDIPLKTGKDGRPELVVKKGSDGTEDVGMGPDGKDWTEELGKAKAAVTAASQRVADAEKKLEEAKTDDEKKAAQTVLTAAKAAEEAAKKALPGAVERAKPVALSHFLQAAEDAAKKALKDGEKNGHFQIYPIDTEQVRYGRDYRVGDVVTVTADGEEYVDVVREVTISVDDGGRSDVAPKVGEQGTGEPLNLYRQVSEMREKLRKLEARM
ncbi:hypothetical protein ACH427_03185 [Streptomyces sp. NPDC020379]|uniref:Gp37-like protein n=1 Tax=Streptomyces sp. NPDC020379 TaxID=3365071 RepID=UPI0037B4E026